MSDANGRMATLATTEILATQDALNALAADTGGRALRNQNYFEGWVEKDRRNECHSTYSFYCSVDGAQKAQRGPQKAQKDLF